MKKSGLGRGLDSLMGLESTAPKESGLQEIDINLIDINKDQARKHFDGEKLQELCQSIRQHGIIQPLILTKKAERYTIVAGERRYRAARLAKMKTVPAVIKEFGSDRLLELSIIENIQREDLNPIEEAKAVDMLMQEHGYTQEAVSERIGRSRSAVANMLRLLVLPQHVQNQVEEGALSAGHARALVALKDDKKIALAAEEIVKEGLSVRATEDLVKRLLAPPKPSGSKVEKKPAEIADAESVLSGSLHTRVHIKGNAQRGRIVIEYFSADQLNALFAFFTEKQ